MLYLNSLPFVHLSACALSDSWFSPVTPQNFTHVSIQVLDVNDNPPQFTRAQYSASVHVATAKEGEFVLSVSATDLDLGNNAVISYRYISVRLISTCCERNTEVFLLILRRIRSLQKYFTSAIISYDF